MNHISLKIFLAAALCGSLVSAAQKTSVVIDGTVKYSDVKRLGLNLGGQRSYDSGQMLKNLISRNPGFEGLMWQSVLQCKEVTDDSCTDYGKSTLWPANFMQGGRYEFIDGAANGRSGDVVSSSSRTTAGVPELKFQLSPGTKRPAINDLLVVRKLFPGDASAGWSSQVSGGAIVSTEFRDLSKHSPGRQAVHLEASNRAQSASLTQYFDSTVGHSFLRMSGPYRLSFRAKGLDGNKQLSVSLRRVLQQGGRVLFRQTVQLSSDWTDYNLEFVADESDAANGTAALSFSATGSGLLLDDVSLTSQASRDNPTAFRSEVVAAIRLLHPGTLRYMDSGTNFGSSLDNMLAVDGARDRTGFSTYSAEAAETPIGLQDFLVLCEAVGAEPWYTIQMGMPQDDMRKLIEYLAGPASSPYGALRSRLGHPRPWTATFPKIHLEYANESWNQIARGASMRDPLAYGRRATTIFSALRNAPGYSSSKFDLILNGFAVNTYWVEKVLTASSGFDTVDFAPYLFDPFEDDSSVEAIFGPMFAEPEMVDSRPGGFMRQQAALVAHAKSSARMAVYETNIGTTNGTVPQASLDRTVPSVGAGIIAIEHMLLMMRDLGIMDQNTFTLSGNVFRFTNTLTHASETVPIWGTVIDMGGQTDRVRPSFLAQELANQAILPVMLKTEVVGEDPTWDQPLSRNGKIHLSGAHLLQSFAFSDGRRSSVILFNLSRSKSLTVSLGGSAAPHGSVVVRTLTSANITDSNEVAENVKTRRQTVDLGRTGTTAITLPPFSMTSVETLLP